MTVSTGKHSTVNDPYIAAPTVANLGDPYATNNGAVNPLGASMWVQDTLSTSTTYQAWKKFTYVRLNATTPPTHWGGPGAPVYWKDETFTVVTMVGSEGLANNNMVAGYLLNSDANLTNGNYIFIQTFGPLVGAIVPASTAIGDAIIGKQTSATVSISSVTYTFYADRTAKDTAPTDKVCAWALTAIASGVADIQIVAEP